VRTTTPAGARSVAAMHRLISLPVASIAAVGALVSGSAHAARAHRIHLVEVERNSTQLDLGAKGFSRGDRQTIVSDLFTPAGRRAGRLDDDCAITQAGSRPEAVCTFTITLKQGQLSGAFAQDLAAPDAAKRQAITGGTGRFAAARGQLVAGREGERTPFVIELR
jgi:hypothetical protein